jgi:ubiquinone biosynthesis protein
MNPIIRKYNKIKNSNLIESEKKILWNNFHNKNAIKIYNFCKMMGGFYIKVCQVLSIRNDVPHQYKELFVNFLDKNKIVEFDRISFNTEDQNICKKCNNIELIPLGSASIGQVHKAKLNNQTVVIKIKYPEIENQMAADFKIIIKLIKQLEPNALPIVNEIINEFKNELQFNNELNNLEEIYNNILRYSPLIKIPVAYNELCSNNIITMEYINGVNLINPKAIILFNNNVDLYNEFLSKKNISPQPKNLVESLIFMLIDILGYQIFNDKIFHADMHPGNILITNDGYISLIDFGLVKRLDHEFVNNFKKIFTNINNHEYDEAYKIIKLIGFSSEKDNMEITIKKFIALFGNNIEKNIDDYLKELDVIDKTINFPTLLIMILRSTGFIRSISQILKLNISFIQNWKIYY